MKYKMILVGEHIDTSFWQMLFLPSFVLTKIFYATDIIFNIHLYSLLQNGVE